MTLCAGLTELYQPPATGLEIFLTFYFKVYNKLYPRFKNSFQNRKWH